MEIPLKFFTGQSWSYLPSAANGGGYVPAKQPDKPNVVKQKKAAWYFT